MIESPDASPAGRRFSVGARFRSFVFAWRGLCWMVSHEHNARVHLAASITVIGAGLMLHISSSDWRWLMLAMGIVWICEALNTAIELLCNRIEPGFDPVIGRIKDVAAAGVLIASVVAVSIGLLTLCPPALQALAEQLPLTLASFSS